MWMVHEHKSMIVNKVHQILHPRLHLLRPAAPVRFAVTVVHTYTSNARARSKVHFQNPKQEDIHNRDPIPRIHIATPNLKV